MIGVDSNIVIRLFVGDDHTQQLKAKALFDAATTEIPIFISSIVVVETIWSLNRLFGYQRRHIVQMLTVLCSMANNVVEHAEEIVEITSNSTAKTDIADELIARANLKFGCSHTMTFDKRAARDLNNMELLT